MYQYKILKWLIDHFSGMVFLGSLVFLISNIEMENLVCKMSILNVWKYFREDFRDKKGRGFEPIFKKKNLSKKWTDNTTCFTFSAYSDLFGSGGGKVSNIICMIVTKS